MDTLQKVDQGKTSPLWTSKNDLDEMIAVIGAEFTGNKMDEAKAAIEMLDVDKDGKVSYPEFILVMKYKK